MALSCTPHLQYPTISRGSALALLGCTVFPVPRDYWRRLLRCGIDYPSMNFDVPRLAVLVILLQMSVDRALNAMRIPRPAQG